MKTSRQQSKVKLQGALPPGKESSTRYQKSIIGTSSGVQSPTRGQQALPMRSTIKTSNSKSASVDRSIGKASASFKDALIEVKPLVNMKETDAKGAVNSKAVVQPNKNKNVNKGTPAGSGDTFTSSSPNGPSTSSIANSNDFQKVFKGSDAQDLENEDTNVAENARIAPPSSNHQKHLNKSSSTKPKAKAVGSNAIGGDPSNVSLPDPGAVKTSNIRRGSILSVFEGSPRRIAASGLKTRKDHRDIEHNNPAVVCPSREFDDSLAPISLREASNVHPGKESIIGSALHSDRSVDDEPFFDAVEKLVAIDEADGPSARPRVCMDVGEPFKDVLYLSNIPANMTFDRLQELVQPFGDVCNICWDANAANEAEIIYDDISSTREAAHYLNGCILSASEESDEEHRLSAELRSRESSMQLFVGDLTPDVTEEMLENAFTEITHSTVRATLKRDPGSHSPIGYGFLDFETESAASKALIEGHRIHVGNARVRVGRAERNTYLYVSDLNPELSLSELKDVFNEHGSIIDEDTVIVRRSYAFIRYRSRASAESAKRALDKTSLKGRMTVRYAEADPVKSVVQVQFHSSVPRPPSSLRDLLHVTFSKYGNCSIEIPRLRSGVWRKVAFVQYHGEPISSALAATEAVQNVKFVSTIPVLCQFSRELIPRVSPKGAPFEFGGIGQHSRGLESTKARPFHMHKMGSFGEGNQKRSPREDRNGMTEGGDPSEYFGHVHDKYQDKVMYPHGAFRPPWYTRGSGNLRGLKQCEKISTNRMGADVGDDPFRSDQKEYKREGHGEKSPHLRSRSRSRSSSATRKVTEMEGYGHCAPELGLPNSATRAGYMVYMPISSMNNAYALPAMPGLITEPEFVSASSSFASSSPVIFPQHPQHPISPYVFGPQIGAMGMGTAPFEGPPPRNIFGHPDQ